MWVYEEVIAVFRLNNNWLSSVITHIQIITAGMPGFRFVLHQEGKVWWSYDIWIPSTMMAFMCEELIKKNIKIILLIMIMRGGVSVVLCSFCLCAFFFLLSLMFCFYIYAGLFCKVYSRKFLLKNEELHLIKERVGRRIKW